MTPEQISKALAEKLTIFVNDPSKRCVIQNPADGTDMCRYSGKSLGIEAEGCLVGLFLSEEDRLKADLASVGTSFSLIRNASKHGITIPEWFNHETDLINEFQRLHDIPDYWGTIGFNGLGKQALSSLIVKHNLVPEHFEHILK